MKNGLKRTIAVLVAGTLLSACGAGDQPSSGGRTEVTVGTSPTISNASLFQAIEDGTFADHDLSVQTQVVTSGAQAVPLLLNGQIQFTAADPLGALVAVSKKTPLVIVGWANLAAADAEHDTSALIVRANSSIASTGDLGGKTVAVNALGSLAEVSARAAIAKTGGDPAKVSFVEMPLPQMIAAVDRGQVDGAVVNDPIATQAVDKGLKVLVSPMSTAMPGTPQLVYLTTKSYAAEHPQIVDAFATSIAAANEALTKDPEQIRVIAKKSTQTDAALLAKMKLPLFEPPEANAAGLDALQQLMVEYDLLPSTLDLDSVVHTRDE